MLVIRMQRTGRKGHAMFRVIVQDSRRTPTSGKIVAALGSYDPHAKTVILNKEKAQVYLDNGAQPSERVAKLLQSEGVKLPKWVVLSDAKASKIRNLEKLRRNRPDEPKEEAAPEAEAEAAPAEAEAAPVGEAAEPEAAAEPAAEETPPSAEEPAAEEEAKA